MKVGVVILNWNGKKDTLECLSSLAEVKKEKTEIETIVVDNASSDGSVTVIGDKFPKITCIQNKENLGFAKGNNIGIRHALKNGSDYILILNNDTTVDPNFISELIASSQRYKDHAIIGAKIYFYPGREFHTDRYKKKDLGYVLWYAGGLMDWNNVLPTHRGVDEVDNGEYDIESETQFVSGCTLFAHRDIFEKVGLFNQNYFAYYEDVELCTRTKKSNYKLIYAPKAVVWHKNAGSSGGSGSATHQYYMIRNQLLFGMRYAPIRAKIALLRQSFVILVKGNKWEKWGVIDYFFAKLGKTERNLQGKHEE